MERQSTSGPGDYLAAERTFLAWIRTGLALMGFGFVVARFGLVPQTFGLSPWFGTALIAMGVIVMAVSTWRHIHQVRELRTGEDRFARPSALAIAVAVTLAVLGAAMAIYLVLVRQPARAQLENRRENAMATNSNSGIVTIPGSHSVDQTVAKLEGILQAKGVKLFAVVDHSGEAAKAGMTMPPTRLLIFGNPKAGTPLMLASPGIAIDLPLKILVSEDPSGKVWISYNAPDYLAARHHLPAELMQTLAVVEALAAAAAG